MKQESSRTLSRLLRSVASVLMLVAPALAQVRHSPDIPTDATAHAMATAALWQFQTGGAIHATPTVHAGTLYVGSLDNFIYALESETGSLIWQQRLGSWIEARPVVSSGRVIVAAMDHKVYALEEPSGAVAWTFETESWLEAAPVADDEHVYIAGLDGYLRALDLHTGIEQWRFDAQAPMWGAPALSNGTLYFGVENTVFAVDRHGKMVWQTALTPVLTIFAGPAVSGNYLILTTIDNGVAYYDSTGEFGSVQNQIIALNATTGAGVWQFTTEPYGLCHSSATVVDDRVYAVTDRGWLRSLHVTTGELLWETIMPDSAASWASPAVADELVYVATYRGMLCSFNKETGTLRDRFDLRSSEDYFHAAPVLTDSRVFAAASDGILYALPADLASAVSFAGAAPPSDFALLQNSPNPFNPTTTLAFTLPRSLEVTITVRDVHGRLVATPVHGLYYAGHHQVSFNATLLASGVYFYRMQADEFRAVRKMVLVR